MYQKQEPRHYDSGAFYACVSESACISEFLCVYMEISFEIMNLKFDQHQQGPWNASPGHEIFILHLDIWGLSFH